MEADAPNQNERNTEKQETISIIYAGQITRDGYDQISETCKKLQGKYKRAALILITTGGDPNAGFRIARALQSNFEDGFEVIVPTHCKSAGTLIAIGAKSLVIADTGELGPLDVQVSKTDELFANSSGLDLPQSIDSLRQQVVQTFRACLLDIRMGGRLSTKIAGEIATNLTTGIFAPVFAQIDPIRLGEMQRANYIGMRYGELLDEKSQNLKADGLAQLVAGYPSHGFVIDRKEAKKRFKNVSAPNPELVEFLDNMARLFGQSADKAEPVIFSLDESNDEQAAEQKRDGGSGDGVSTVSALDGGNGQSNPETGPDGGDAGTSAGAEVIPITHAQPQIE